MTIYLYLNLELKNSLSLFPLPLSVISLPSPTFIREITWFLIRCLLRCGPSIRPSVLPSYLLIKIRAPRIWGAHEIEREIVWGREGGCNKGKSKFAPYMIQFQFLIQVHFSITRLRPLKTSLVLTSPPLLSTPFLSRSSKASALIANTWSATRSALSTQLSKVCTLSANLSISYSSVCVAWAKRVWVVVSSVSGAFLS